jgi:hypothetical protein
LRVPSLAPARRPGIGCCGRARHGWGGWERIVPASVITGVDGKTYAPQCTGYPGTDNQFSFWVQRTTSRNVLVYFEGGGACWDNLTCTYPLVDGLPQQVPQFFIPAVVAGTDPAGFDGIFKDDPANPVRDWNKVYIPCSGDCSGDIHVGSASRDGRAGCRQRRPPAVPACPPAHLSGSNTAASTTSWPCWPARI